MAFTQSDLETVEKAILAIAAGKRKVRADIGGETVEFQAAGLARLYELRDIIRAELPEESGGGIIHKVSFVDAD